MRQFLQRLVVVTALLDDLLTEQRNLRSAEIDTLPIPEMLRVLNEEDAQVSSAVALAIPAISLVVKAAADAINAGGRIFYIGAGTSGRLGVLDASECPPTFGVPPEWVQGIIAGGEPALSRATEASEDDPGSGVADLIARDFRRSDVLVGIAASGRTPYVLGAVRHARQLGSKTAGICCTADSLLSQTCEIPIELLVGPEVITGSTRMKAGTATKLALNMISTGTMIRVGYVFGNLMVNVQPKNDKLKDRARRIIRDAAQVTYEEASELLNRSNSVAAAIVMAKREVDFTTAKELLARAGGKIRKALEL